MNKDSIRRVHHVDHWKKFAAPTYPTIVTTEHYHMVRDKDSAKYYIELNHADRSLPKNNHRNHFHKMTDRKEIDTFFNLNESRFEMINKTPKVLTTVPRPTGINFNGHKNREPLWPEHEQTTFYET